MIVEVDIESLSQADKDHRDECPPLNFCMASVTNSGTEWACTRRKGHSELIHLGGFPNDPPGFAWYDDQDIPLDEVIADLKAIEKDLRQEQT